MRNNINKCIFKLLILFIGIHTVSCAQNRNDTYSKDKQSLKKQSIKSNTGVTKDMSKKKYNIEKTDAEWKSSLNEEEYRILREKGTERPFTGVFDEHFKEGEYTCKGCGETLFLSDTKFNSGCGWPAFDEAVKGAVDYEEDRSLNRIRTEIICSNCGGHLGHVFNDGPTETGLRYCVNSASLNFKNDKNE